VVIRPNLFHNDKHRLGKRGFTAQELRFEGCNSSGYYACHPRNIKIHCVVSIEHTCAFYMTHRISSKRLVFVKVFGVFVRYKLPYKYYLRQRVKTFLLD